MPCKGCWPCPMHSRLLASSKVSAPCQCCMNGLSPTTHVGLQAGVVCNINFACLMWGVQCLNPLCLTVCMPHTSLQGESTQAETHQKPVTGAWEDTVNCTTNAEGCQGIQRKLQWAFGAPDSRSAGCSNSRCFILAALVLGGIPDNSADACLLVSSRSGIAC